MKRELRRLRLNIETVCRLDRRGQAAARGWDTVDQSDCLSCLMSGCPLTCDTICC